MEKEVRTRVKVTVALALLVIISLFHVYNSYVEEISSQAQLLQAAIAIVVVGAAAVFVLRAMKSITDERSEFINSVTGRYSFTANMCLMIAFMFYEIFLGITLEVPQFIAFVTISIALMYAALYVSVGSYY